MTSDEVILITNYVDGSNLDKILFSKHLNDKVRIYDMFLHFILLNIM